ncbi:hypothetical protein QBC39DRAFT_345113 [Podospora conica]|nr:hypothetical protein QBC39DRAFT_345113 [Schizothecium conicum]
MKVTSPLFIFALTAAVDAAAVAELQEDKRWCVLPGQPCWKRDADIQEDKRWCVLPGQPCWKRDAAASAMTEAFKTAGGLSARDDGFSPSAAVAKRQIDALALAIAASQANPSSYYYGLNLPSHFAAEPTETETATEKRDASPWCVLPGQPCWKRSIANEKREANPWCVLPGQPCWKRDAAPDAAAEEDKRWCVLPGQPCWKAKRAAEAVLSAITSTHENQARSLPFAPEARLKREAAPWCVLPGQPCWKRDAAPEAAQEDKRWCVLPGQPCWKKRSEEKRCVINGQPCFKRDASAEASCNTPGGACTLAQRDLHAVYNIARGIVDAHSE